MATTIASAGSQDAQQAKPSRAFVPVQRQAVSDTPMLAPEAELIGEMLGTGFADKMWLVQLDGRFVQITELLYRVAEQCTGRLTYDEIATNVSATTEWQMSGGDARYLVVNKLVPAGIVIDPESTTVDPDRPRSAPSLLRLGLRRGMISGEQIEPVAKRLQVLFNPVLMIPLLTLGLAAHAWLYLDRGVSGLLSNVLNTPGLLIVVFVMSLLPGFWHEFGHASALRYGGGRARGIGVGIYIMDPAFYTDVTDSYRLGRWGRVRTGLGGVYFDLMLSTVFIIGYHLTGAEVLLLLVVLANVNMAYQFMPLVRLDGYWILADLTGVPDFYSMMGPFVRSVVPIKRWKGTKLPELRRWVKVVFGAYTLIAFPSMLVFMFLLIRRVPGLVTMTWNAMRSHLEGMPVAWSAGDWFMVAAQASQVLLLTVTMIGLTYFMVTLVRTYGRLLWQLGRYAATRSRLVPALGKA